VQTEVEPLVHRSRDQKTEIRVYGLRNMLEGRGAKVPPAVVDEEVIGPAKE
jgi:hypothetical protein